MRAWRSSGGRQEAGRRALPHPVGSALSAGSVADHGRSNLNFSAPDGAHARGPGGPSRVGPRPGARSREAAALSGPELLASLVAVGGVAPAVELPRESACRPAFFLGGPYEPGPGLPGPWA